MKKVLLGNEAVARGAYEAGCRVAVGYPGTPSTEILETVSRDYKDTVYCQWSPNEKVAFEVAAGAAIAGARSLCTTKHVGLNVAADPLFTFSYTGVNAGLVILNADDPGAWSSQNEQDNRHYARSAKVPMLDASDPNEAKEFVRRAFEISEQFDRPVIVRVTTRISHSQGVVDCSERVESELKEFPLEPKKYVMIPAHARPRHVFIEEQMEKLKDFSYSSDLNKVEMKGKKRGIITNSVAYHYVKETCPDDSVLKIGMVWPLPDKLIREFADQVEELVVVEELDPFIEDYVKAMGYKVKGKEVIPMCGELTPDIVNAALNNVVNKNDIAKYDKPLPPRPPALCKGCPHIYVFDILKKNNIIVNGDIGCYTLGVLPPYSSMHSQGCMGASVSMHLGFEKAHPELARKSVAVIGDSTFVHSGITGLVDIVYNKGTGTVLILDNRTTGMTGHQENPATGKTLMEEETHELDFVKLSEAVGVKRVNLIDPKDSEELEKMILAEVAAEEPSVIVIKRKCILVK